jgi:hypothetical protein
MSTRAKARRFTGTHAPNTPGCTTTFRPPSPGIMTMSRWFGWIRRDLSDGSEAEGFAPAVWLFCWWYERERRRLKRRAS